MKIGMGYDVHKLVENRPLIIGGEVLDYELGLLGHSDADVLIHAIMDAILGALSLGDIGLHFPDTDPKFKGVSSMALLEEVRLKMEVAGYEIGNLDALVIAQKPKLRPYFDQMTRNIARSLKCNENKINLKATTTETLGFEGRGEGIASQAIVLLQPSK